MNRNLVTVILYNIFCVLCWALLAVCFGKWWIGLFALLFMAFPHTVKLHYRICDKCGKHGPMASNHNEAINSAVLCGWKHISESNQDYCPDCQQEDIA